MIPPPSRVWLCASPFVRRAQRDPLPSTGEGEGGGECRRRFNIERLPPIPTFPHQGEGENAFMANQVPNSSAGEGLSGRT
jgi:hypothetical protein